WGAGEGLAGREPPREGGVACKTKWVTTPAEDLQGGTAVPAGPKYNGNRGTTGTQVDRPGGALGGSGRVRPQSRAGRGVPGCGAGKAAVPGAPAEGVGQGVDRAPAGLRAEDGLEGGGGAAVRPVLAAGRRRHVLLLRPVLLAAGRAEGGQGHRGEGT